jgi:tripartite-type tricarboxylate transporter receptor subunit TctC
MAIAANACKGAAADGYTICLLTQNAITLNPLLYARLSYDPYKELEPVAAVAFQQQVLAVVSSVGVNSFADLVKHSKEKPDALNYASLGPGSDSHLILEWLKGATGGSWTHVPFNGAPAILTAMKSGQVHITLLTSGSLKPHIDSGDLKGLFTRGSERRNPTLPNVPTYAEAGLPPLTATSWAGMFAPAGTPPDVIARLNREITAIINEPEFRNRYMVQPGLEPPSVPLAAMKEFMAKDRAAWEPLVKNSGVQLQ